jgi:lysophospholipase L1-like esterase
MEEFKKNPIEKNATVFLGNSLTEGGNWSLFFPEQTVCNRGISGDNTLGVLNRLGEIISAQPKAVFLLIGINDISLNRKNDKIFGNIKAIVYQLQAASPQTEIYIQSLFPINNDFKRYSRLSGKELQIKDLNANLKEFCNEENIPFVYLYPILCSSEEKDKLNPEFTVDGLHLNEKGYRAWATELKKHIK